MFRTPEQQNFHDIVRMHVRQKDGPLLLEGGTGLGKTRAYLAALMEAVRLGQRIAVVLPTHQLIDQLMHSSDLAATRGEVQAVAFRPARLFERQRDYEAHKAATLAAPFLVCTAASVIIDHRLGGEYNGATSRDYLLFDEVDQLPDMAALQSDFRIRAEQIQSMGVPTHDAKAALVALLAAPPRTLEPETRAAARVILEAIESPAWYQSAGIDDDGDIVLTHRLPGRLLKKISNRGNVAFVSATLTIGGRFDDFCHAMAIEARSRLSSMVEPSVHGHLDFHSHELEVDTPPWMDEVVATIQRAPQPVLVATTSHDLSQQLGLRCPAATVRRPDESTAEAAQRCSGILISAGAWAGLDTPMRWRSIVVPRLPFGQPNVVEGEVTTRYLDARNTAVRRLRQVIGRGLRSPEARCSVYLLDGRIKGLQGFIPERFERAWSERIFLEGGRVEVTLSKVERDPAVRQAALKRYGSVCMGCGFRPHSQNQLDVHHCDPISEGVRRTRLEDVAVLCANCHRLVHSTQPPMSIEHLRERLKAAG